MNEKVIKNLMEAFAGESQANRKYLAFAEKAKKDGFEAISKLFKATADAETIHAFTHLKTAGKVKDTIENIKSAIEGETFEYKEMYPDFIKTAEEANDKAAIRTFSYASKAESVHAKLYEMAYEAIQSGKDLDGDFYLCPVCGNIEREIPDKCSICNVPGTKFIKY